MAVGKDVMVEAQPAKTVVKALIVALFFALLAGADALALPRAVVAGRPRAACVRQHNPLNMHASSGEDHVRRTTEQHYKDMRQHQCLHYQRQMEDEWLQFNKAELTIKQALDIMDTFVDKSDPATSLPTVHHMMQVAETMRCCGEPDWMQLVGLIRFSWVRVHLEHLECGRQPQAVDQAAASTATTKHLVYRAHSTH